jgi:lipopolysaccharide transport system ATP-binding protein
MPAAITVDGLSKCYRVTPAGGSSSYRTLRESLTDWALKPVRRWRGKQTEEDRGEFWALKDVSVDVQPGEVVGIVGRNGAGKSTLLKILSRITKPTRGRVELHGRVGSLLEVGTGFHPELTGRENIYLNGSILGMRRREIAAKFDDIVEFSGVGKFLETPVKRYSSGMYVRLAFAVAANLEPEILLVDEVLAVGDQEFQKKCLGKMTSVARSGRTVFFVSHQMAAVEALCSRVLVLEKGSLVTDGAPNEGIEYYLSRLREAAAACPLADRTDRGGNGDARFTALRFYDADGNLTNHVPCGGTVVVEADVVCSRPVEYPLCSFIFFTPRAQRLFRLCTADAVEPLPALRGRATYRCRVDNLNLMPGSYPVMLRLHEASGAVLDDLEAASELTVIPRDTNGTGRVPGTRFDLMFVASNWSWDTEPDESWRS